MDYTLAKRLKDAGFPQPPTSYKGRFMSGGTEGKAEEMIRAGNGEVIKKVSSYSPQLYVPTLEELIEACGEGIFNLLRQSEWHKQETGFAWKATIAKLDKPFSLTLDNIEKAMIDAYGETAEIAVVNLFLALKGLKK